MSAIDVTARNTADANDGSKNPSDARVYDVNIAAASCMRGKTTASSAPNSATPSSQAA